MDSVNKTLYIPLYGKAMVSRRGLLLRDPEAEKIWAEEGFPLKGKARSKWLAYYMGCRAAVFDRWTAERLRQNPQAVAVHLGCGLDSRASRVGSQNLWLDVDFPEVIGQRKRWFRESDSYRMIGGDIREPKWLEAAPRGAQGVLILEGVSMYLTVEELKTALSQWRQHFGRGRILMDCYTQMAAKATKYRNPINEVGVTQVYGLDDPRLLEEGTGITFLREWDMTPPDLTDTLPKGDRRLFRTVFCGGFSRKLYRLYEFEF